MDAITPPDCRVLVAFLALIASARLPAQGVTTGGIDGIVRDGRGRGIPLADVEVLDRATGFVTRARTRDDGRYTASGLEVGGPYRVTVRHIGHERALRDGIFVTIGQTLRVDFVLTEGPVAMQAVTTTARAAEPVHPAYAVGTLISDSLVHRLPVSDRDLYGLVKLVPQMSTWYGLSAAGASPRVNAVMIDGASEQGLYGGNAAAAIWGGKAISLEAIKEYQVLLSPFDVRHGNFAGALINAVTRRGSNDVHGSLFYYGRYGALSRNVPFIHDAYYERAQTGVTIAGPLVRDRAHAFVAAEFQRLRFPTIGPYVGQPAGATPTLRVAPDTLARFQSIVSQLGMIPGSSGPITASNPLANVFGRVDVALPTIRSRLVVRENYSRTDSAAFSRPSPPPTANCRSIVCFPLSSLSRQQVVWKDGTVAQLLTARDDGTYNELIVGRLNTVSTISPALRQPLVIVQLGASALGQTLQAGAYEAAQSDKTDNRSVELTDNLSIPRGAHNVTLGGSAQLYRVRRLDLRGAFGVWTFSSLDALARRQAQSYRVSSDYGGADVTVPGAQYALYAGDRWDVTGRLSLTYGLRADVPRLNRQPPHNARVGTLFGYRTEAVPSGHVHWSPRLGVTWDADARTRVGGGAGVYMGRPPLSWIVNAYGNYGMPRTLACGASPALPPSFSADADHPPLACANGQAITPDSVGSVNLLDPRLRFPQNLRASFALERALRPDISVRIESQYTKAINELFFVNRNLASPASTSLDAHGRLMYGTLGATGRAAPAAAQPAFHADVIELTNQSKDHSYGVTAAVTKQFASTLNANVSFTYARARDVQSHRFTRNPAFDNWRLGRTVTGRQDVATVGVSDFDQPYRVVAGASYAFVHRSSTTDVSLYYVGASGFPFTYLAGGDQQTGDLNADGTSLNDPIYVPRDVDDPAEIVFDSSAVSAASQRAALASFINGAACLRRQRGRIMERNSCRSPWTNTLNAALRQSVPHAAGIAAELQVFNLLNLLNRRWGHVAIPGGLATPSSQVNLLTHTGQTATTPARSIFRFDPATPRFDATSVDSYYQIQLGLRYNW